MKAFYKDGGQNVFELRSKNANCDPEGPIPSYPSTVITYHNAVIAPLQTYRSRVVSPHTYHGKVMCPSHTVFSYTHSK